MIANVIGRENLTGAVETVWRVVTEPTQISDSFSGAEFSLPGEDWDISTDSLRDHVAGQS